MKTTDIYNFRQLFFLDKFLVGHKGFAAGGCFKNIFNNEPVKDIDIFFIKQEYFIEAKEHFLDLIKKEPDNWSKSYNNKNVWAIYSIKDKIRIELIKSVFGTPEQIIDDFDFTITKFAYYTDYGKADEDDYLAQFEVMYHEDYFEHLQTKKLVLDNAIPFPISTFNRSYKYQKYGYGLCRESKIKLLQSIYDLPSIDAEQLGLYLYDGKD
ncbi:hypothetical protein K6G95_002554 [Listeria monocytogenes]|nr:hypothetical protein [Listeria monocytogenes]EID7723578.1 hypothetical protein [Listeria monocytogenes]EID7726643.1 hypothetical protein [Listeria monocytogenes]EID7729714.1 hypothetical protein [Listeria monocytogenes]EID7732774.1 hypothetical protein [Listeria monocytogenes]